MSRFPPVGFFTIQGLPGSETIVVANGRINTRVAVLSLASGAGDLAIGQAVEQQGITDGWFALPGAVVL